MNAYNDLVQALANSIKDHLRDGLDPVTYAKGILEQSDLSQPEISFEVRASHTARGNPFTSCVDVPESVRASYPGETP